MSRKHPTLIRDIVLIIAVLMAGVVLLFVLRGRNKEGSYVVVMFQNEEKARYSLALDGVYDINDGKNVIEKEMHDADCPDRYCVRQGWIEYDGQSIICLPNMITVMVSGGDRTVDFVL